MQSNTIETKQKIITVSFRELGYDENIVRFFSESWDDVNSRWYAKFNLETFKYEEIPDLKLKSSIEKFLSDEPKPIKWEYEFINQNHTPKLIKGVNFDQVYDSVKIQILYPPEMSLDDRILKLETGLKNICKAIKEDHHSNHKYSLLTAANNILKEIF